MPVVNTQECNLCGGTGTIEEGTCPTCSGTGEIPMTGCTHAQTEANVKHTVLLVDTLLLPTNVFDSYTVVEEVDATEYAALSDEAKDGINLYLSCGKIDLNEGTNGRTTFWAVFDSASTTRANLVALLT